MKILQTSDIHLGSKITAHLDERRASVRRRELQDGFARLVREAQSLGAEAVIIAGDLFDTETVSRRLVEATLATISSNKSIIFFYLPGNHEGDALARANIPLPENLKIFGDDWTSFELGEVTIVGRSRLGLDLTASLPRGAGKTIAVLHGELRDGASSDKIIGMRDIERSGIDYLALGHYHSYSAHTLGHCTAVYSGTPEGRGFDEAGERGYVLISVEGSGISHSFIPGGGRRLTIVEADITGDKTQSEVEATVGRALLGVRGDDMVRVVLVGQRGAETSHDTESITRRYSREYFYFEAKDKSTLALRAEDFANDKSLMGEFVRLVLGDGSLSKEEQDKILECGLRALRGEETIWRSGY